MTSKIKADWRRGGCVGGDCDTVYPRTQYKGRTGRIAVLEKVDGADLAALEHQPAAHEEAVFIPDDIREHLG